MISIEYDVIPPSLVSVEGIGFMTFNQPKDRDSFTIDTPSTFFEQGGIYGQNNVDHRKITGSLSANPFSYDHINYFDPTSQTYKFTLRSSYNQIMHRTFDHNPFVGYEYENSIPDRFALYGWSKTDTFRGLNERCTLFRNGTCAYTRHELISFGKVENGSQGALVYYHVKRTHLESDVPFDFDFDDVSHEQVIAAAMSGSRVNAVQDINSFGTLYSIVGSNTWQPRLNARQIKRLLSDRVSKLFAMNSPSDDLLPHYGDLAAKAANKRFDITENFLESSIELLSLKSLLKTFLKKTKKLADFPKDASGHYLALKYGILPMKSDIEAIIASISRIPHTDNLGFRVETGTKSVFVDGYHVERRVHLALKQISFAKSNPLRNLGLAPTIGNLWDIVPYSFVVDWFVDISSVLDDIQMHADFLSLPLAYTISSQKMTYETSMDDLGLSGSLVLTDYVRYVGDAAPKPNYVGSSLSTPTANKHWLEGSALIIQRKK